ncbi:MFS transporter [Fluviibacterium sp. S390]|uniref:MFS transporter n=1 Tax=Fluviibacterium sp. S390 TaxID=3415139 RepID=UPI003C7AAFD1
MQFQMNSRRIWGWYFFDWASQPYNTLLLTFIFGPYVTELVGDGTAAQSAWGYGVGAAGVVIALLAPLLGSIADRTGPGTRMLFIWVFSACYVIGAWSLWAAAPDSFNLWMTLAFFGLGLLGMEFATIFTNAMLPDLAPKGKIGRVSGNGWAFGYLGGLLALIFMLVFLADNASTGKTLIGLDPPFGLDATKREGTRAVGPFTALWFMVFMIPFFAWVHAPKPPPIATVLEASRAAWPDLKATLRGLRHRASLRNYLIASMLYRDALNGLYFFGGVYAAGVLNWSVIDVGVFGILAVVSATVVAWIGGMCDERFGPMPVIVVSILCLIGATLAAIFISRASVFGMAVEASSRLPDIAFYGVGVVIGAAGGALQASSRTMMVFQAEKGHATREFGLYALAGKATSFAAPILVAVTTDLTGSQQLGITPLLALFIGGLIVLGWVKSDGEQ